jgi:hypothetical protein
MIEVSMVPAEYIDTCWKKIEHFIKKAAEYTYGRYSAENLYDMVKEGEHQLWVAYDGSDFKSAVLTNVMNYPQCKVLCMGFCGGEELDEWIDPMLSLLKRYAKDMGCDSIEAFGRPGWSKILKKFGYQNKWITFELSIKE